MKRAPCQFVAVFLLAGCGSDQDIATPKQKQGKPSAAIPQALAGDWTRRFSRREAHDEPAGRWTMRLSGNTMELYEGPSADADKACITQEWCDQFDVEAKGNLLTIGATPLCTGPGTYSFRIRGRKLTLREVRDACQAGRGLIFDGTTWRRR